MIIDSRPAKPVQIITEVIGGTRPEVIMETAVNPVTGITSNFTVSVDITSELTYKPEVVTS